MIAACACIQNATLLFRLSAAKNPKNIWDICTKCTGRIYIFTFVEFVRPSLCLTVTICNTFNPYKLYCTPYKKETQHFTWSLEGTDYYTMGISASEKCINKEGWNSKKGKKWSNLALFFGGKSLKIEKMII